ncbi:MAG: hypothetical protein H0S79_21270 [Anaerolineaceae bacterium]|nr:hypothetical protein [Anaerolineaceae bacterium]
MMENLNSEAPIIGKEKIVSDLLGVITAQDGLSHFIPILGPGGAGKTTLLNLLYKEIQELDNYSYFAIYYDYRDLMSQSYVGTLINVILQIWKKYAHIFSKDAFEEFTDCLLNSPDNLESLKKITSTELKKLKDHKIRIVLLEDSLDQIRYPSQYIIDAFTIGSFIPNCVVIVSGRPEDNMKGHVKQIKAILEKQNWALHDPEYVEPFNNDESDTFFTSQFDSSFNKNIMRKLYLLTNGSPILLAISAELYRRNSQIDLLQMEENDLLALIETEPEKTLEQFKYQIFSIITRLETNFDWGLLYFSFLNRRYDRKILKILLEQTEEEIDRFENIFKQSQFLRRSIISSDSEKELLHDEMQGMVNDHLWDSIDHFRDYRKDIARKVISEFYEPEIDELQTKLISMAPLTKSADSVEAYWKLEVALSELQNEVLDYTFRIDEREGFDYFQSLLAEIEKKEYPALSMMLLLDGVSNLDFPRSQFLNLLYESGVKNCLNYDRWVLPNEPLT